MVSSSRAPSGAAAASRERGIRIGIGALAAVNLLTGLYMVVDPAGFVDRIGPFGIVNEHYVRDIASWTLAYAAVLVIAVGDARWRVPVLGFGIVQSALHIVNHVVDIGDADPGWVGWFDLVALSALLGVTVWLLNAARDEQSGAQVPR
jgi:hypothetical protein